MTIKIEMLRAFAIVAESGTLAEAATRLRRTPSAISMTLKGLEEHLGQRLFATDRKNRLTPLGEYVLDQARRELQQFDATISAIEGFATAPQGLIQVAAVPSVAGMIFPQVVGAFLARHPGVSVEIRDMDSIGILEALTRGRIDIGIAAPAGPVRGVRAVPLFSDAFGLIMARDHPLATRSAPLRLADLGAQQVLRNELSDRIEAVREATGTARMSALNTLTLTAMVRGGQWVTVLPSTVIQIDPERLAFRAFEDLGEHRQVDLLMREDRVEREEVSDFAAMVRAVDWDQRAKRPGA
ncbi:MAG: LysR family transcriptional regulator [Nioella sp.]|nr:LysR family transcriptional regulator [Nioella sp.]